MTPARWWLGIDVNVESFGYATALVGHDGNPYTLDCGQTISYFSQLPSGKIEKFEIGACTNTTRKDRGVYRRNRRTLHRRASRKRDFFRVAQGVCPKFFRKQNPGESLSNTIDSCIADLDSGIRKKYREMASAELRALAEARGDYTGASPARFESDYEQKWIYWLSSHALTHKITLEEVFRCFYRLCSHRGWSPPPPTCNFGAKREKEPIEKIKAQLKAIGDLTYSQYIVQKLSLHTKAIRGVDKKVPGSKGPDSNPFVTRDMILREFDALWKAQAPYHPEMTPDLYCVVRHLIKFQRPLRSCSDKVGMCEVEPNEKRARRLRIHSQQQRYMQKVNDLRICPSNAHSGESVPLTDEQKKKLNAVLEIKKEVGLEEIREILGLSKDYVLNHQDEEGSFRKLHGNRTSATIRPFFGQTITGYVWDSFSREKKEQFVGELLSVISSGQGFQKMISREPWNLSPEIADEFREALLDNLEPNYGKFSMKALRKIVPRLEAGVSLQTIIHEDFKPAFKPTDRLTYLPPPTRRPWPRGNKGEEQSKHPDLSDHPDPKVIYHTCNALVLRNLAHIGKQVNSLIRQYGGAPEKIFVETTSSLTQPNDVRKSIHKSNTLNGLLRTLMIEVLTLLMGHRPNHNQVEKFRLWIRQRGVDPYSLSAIPLDSILVAEGGYEIDHIIPSSRIMDNSLHNKVLCSHSNNTIKSNRTPFEFFGADVAHFDAMVASIEGNRSDLDIAKWLCEELQKRDPDWRCKLTNWGVVVKKKEKEKEEPTYDPRDIGIPGYRLADFNSSLSGRLQNYFKVCKAEDVVKRFNDRHLQDTSEASRVLVRYLGVLYGCSLSEPGIGDDRKRHIITVPGEATSQLRKRWGLDSLLSKREGVKNRADARHHIVDAAAIMGYSTEVERILSGESVSMTEGRINILPPWPTFREDLQRVLNPPRDSQVVKFIGKKHKIRGPLHNETNLNPNGGHRYEPTAVKKADANGKALDEKKTRFVYKSRPPKLMKEGSENFVTISSGVRARRVLTENYVCCRIYETTNSKGKVIWEGELVSRIDAKKPPSGKFKGKLVKVIWSGDTLEIYNKKAKRVVTCRVGAFDQGARDKETGERNTNPKIRVYPIITAIPSTIQKTQGIRPNTMASKLGLPLECVQDLPLTELISVNALTGRLMLDLSHT